MYVFSKKTLVGHVWGLKQMLYLPEMQTFEFLIPTVFKYQPI